MSLKIHLTFLPRDLFISLSAGLVFGEILNLIIGPNAYPTVSMVVYMLIGYVFGMVFCLRSGPFVGTDVILLSWLTTGLIFSLSFGMTGPLAAPLAIMVALMGFSIGFTNGLKIWEKPPHGWSGRLMKYQKLPSNFPNLIKNEILRQVKEREEHEE